MNVYNNVYKYLHAYDHSIEIFKQLYLKNKIIIIIYLYDFIQIDARRPARKNLLIKNIKENNCLDPL